MFHFRRTEGLGSGQLSSKFATKQSREACWWSVVLQIRQMSRLADLHPGDFPRSLPRSAISGEGASACTCSWSSAAEPRSGRWLSGWTFYLHRNKDFNINWQWMEEKPIDQHLRSLFYFMLWNAQKVMTCSSIYQNRWWMQKKKYVHIDHLNSFQE